MSSINDIDTQLKIIEEKVADHMMRLEKCSMDISEAMNKVQSEFGSAKEGQELVRILYASLRELSTSAGPLSVVKVNLNNYIRRLHQ